MEEHYELTRYGAELKEIATKRGLSLEEVVVLVSDEGADPEVFKVLIYKDYGDPDLRREIFSEIQRYTSED